MAYTYEQLSRMTVAQLRQIAEGIENDALHGFRTMHKVKLLAALCKALNIETHVHHEVVGVNKTEIKSEIRVLKKQRDEAMSKKDYAQLKTIRNRIHQLKRTLRRYMV